MGGALVQWLRDEMELLDEASDSNYLASKVEDTNGVVIVPAFAGLGAPYWDMYARGTIIGLTRGSNRNHIIRAALEAIAYQSKDVIDAMIQDSGLKLTSLKVDGGATENDFLMQFQSDILNTNIQKPKVTETTALGAAYLAGLAVGFWSSKDDIKDNWSIARTFIPEMPAPQVESLYKQWKRAVERSKNWEQDTN